MNAETRLRAGSPDDVLDWSWPVAQVPSGGRRLTKVATEAERAAFATALGLVGCQSLSAEIELRPLAGDRFRATGRARAQIVQSCVVTLEPVEAALDEPIDTEFWPSAQIAEANRKPLDIEDDTEFEAIDDSAIRFGRVVYDCLASGIDPYPRKPGAELTGRPVNSASQEAAKVDSPFAVLARLKDRPQTGGR